jgi:hypothetical protein
LSVVVIESVSLTVVPSAVAVAVAVLGSVESVHSAVGGAVLREQR